ncbi:hypothetical protein IJG04_01335 [Candidatus Saccharibacteria bacterium]|nr:hypothetical protein [Candidatus Saccharibacteria bacterium]
MAYAKNKNIGGRKSSTNIHTPRTTIKSSQRSISKRFDRKVFASIKKIILSIILLASLAVILATIFTITATPENTVKSKIESITADYYENFYYENLITFATTERTLEQIMQPYAEHGFTKVTLEQLLLFDNQRHADSANILTTYCNDTATYITIYPDPPYNRTDYHVNYNYSCNF